MKIMGDFFLFTELEKFIIGYFTSVPTSENNFVSDNFGVGNSKIVQLFDHTIDHFYAYLGFHK